jgi:ribosomal protein S16
MKRTFFILSLVALGCGAISLIAQVANKKPGIEARLEQALRMFPDADADKDGALSINEALAYVEKHPEARDKFMAKAGNSKSSSKPASFAPGAEGTKVFVCAHSYMIYTADWLPQIAQPAGVAHLKAGQQMIGGSRVLQHWNLPDEQNQAKKALKEGIVDVLTLSPHLLMPDEGIDHFTKLGLEKNPDLRVLVQASWAPRDGRLVGSFTNAMRDSVTADEIRRMQEAHHGWLKQLEAQVSALNTSLGRPCVFVVPVSTALHELRKQVAEGKAPGLGRQSELFRDDHGHPSDISALLVSYCHFAAIYQRTPVGLPVPEKLKSHPQAAELVPLLQRIAWEAVTSHPMSGVKVAAGA